MNPITRTTYVLLYALAFGSLIFGLSTNQDVLAVAGGLGCLLLVRSAYHAAKGRP